jgi:hypothetical protein
MALEAFLHFENKRENKRVKLICFPASLLLGKSLLIYSYVFSVVDLTKAIKALELVWLLRSPDSY